MGSNAMALLSSDDVHSLTFRIGCICNRIQAEVNQNQLDKASHNQPPKCRAFC